MKEKPLQVTVFNYAIQFITVDLDIKRLKNNVARTRSLIHNDHMLACTVFTVANKNDSVNYKFQFRVYVACENTGQFFSSLILSIILPLSHCHKSNTITSTCTCTFLIILRPIIQRQNWLNQRDLASTGSSKTH